MSTYQHTDVQAIQVGTGLASRILIDLLLAAAGFAAGVAFLVSVGGPFKLDEAVIMGVVGAGWPFGVRLVWRYLPGFSFGGSIGFVSLAFVIYYALKLWLGLLIGVPALVWRGACDILALVRAAGDGSPRRSPSGERFTDRLNRRACGPPLCTKRSRTPADQKRLCPTAQVLATRCCPARAAGGPVRHQEVGSSWVHQVGGTPGRTGRLSWSRTCW